MSIESRPKVRDLTQLSRHLPIEVDGGSMYELLLLAWLVFDSREEHTSFELGSDWFAQVADETPAHLRAELKHLGGERGDTWCGLRGLVAVAPGPHDIGTVLEWLERLDPLEIRRGLLSYQSLTTDDPDTIERAVGGDREALELLLGDNPEASAHCRELFSMEEGVLRERLVTALAQFRAVYRRFEPDFVRATAKAARETTPMVKGADPERVIESVTNGLDYRIRPGVSRLVLVPSVVARPWAVIDQYQDVLMVVFPVADEYIDAEPDAPPSWVVKVHKALGDEKRLRILRRLAEGPAGLDDLADMLELTKSTVHHHVGLLRGAGLVRVSVDPTGGAKTYAIRPTVLPGAHQALDEYLKNEDLDNPSTVRSER
jgi:DNA-binding transcriptional ArsR family regulator